MSAVLQISPDENSAPEAGDMMPAPLRVLLVEAGSPSLVQDLLLNGANPVVEMVAGEEAFTTALREFKPDAVIAALGGTAFGACEALPLLRAELPGTPLIALATAIEDQAGIACLRAADGVVPKSGMAALASVIEAAVKLRRPLRKLSPRQLEVLRLVADGRSTREIGELLGLSMKTVESHRGAVMKRLARHNVADLVRYAVRTGVVTD